MTVTALLDGMHAESAIRSLIARTGRVHRIARLQRPRRPRDGGTGVTDTRDADDDGIYCEALPCPCLKPGDGGTTTPTQHRKVRLGRSVTFAPARKRSGSRVRGALPDAGCTPGARYSRVGKAQVCRPGYASSVRQVTESTRDAVYAAYGLSRHFNGSDGEVDHLVSLELGGSNVRSNLFPEAATPRPGSHEKDRLENRLHAEVCSGAITLQRARA